MKHTVIFILAIVFAIGTYADKFYYRFNSTPLADALSKISDEHPEIEINFIYNELENYKSNAAIDTYDPNDAIRKAIGLNPVTMQRKGNVYFIEALQHGRFCYTGRVVGADNEPVVAATVFILNPKDSTVITYGITDATGNFVIPCDRQRVLAKLSCLGFHTVFRKLDSFSAGIIIMPEKTVALKEVKVDADDAFLYSDKSVYIPNARQINAAQTGWDLINSMSIPQLLPGLGKSVQTISGKSVDFFIDFVPASEQDLEGMRMADVKKVEYYDHPSDPRLLGKPYVINFIMQRYEYGGYVKGYVSANVFDEDVHSGTGNGYAKLQYKKMTYDVAGGAFISNTGHEGADAIERFRLPQGDGTVKEFERNTTLTDSRCKTRSYWTSMKALYETEKTTVSNMVSVGFYRIPEKRMSGDVSYMPAAYSSGTYSSHASERENYVVYEGYWNFVLPHSNTLVITPYFAHSHTVQSSVFEETGFTPIVNGARDNSNVAKLMARMNHDFGKWGKFSLHVQGLLYKTRTSYNGTSDISDGTTTTRVGPGAIYSIKAGNFYGSTGIGLLWDRSAYGNIAEVSGVPWADLSLQYAFNTRHSISGEFHFSESVPSSSYRSESIVRSNPLFSYTGNPELRPYSNFDFGGNYIFIPSKKYRFSVYGTSWIVKDRYFFYYEASPDGIMRTIRQPGGTYTDVSYGIFAAANYLDGKLRFSASLRHDLVHNGAPYDWTKSFLTYSLWATYYVGNFNFGASYISPQQITNDCMGGTWVKTKDQYSIQGGWGADGWNIKFYLKDIFRWKWIYGTTVMDSGNYSFHQTDISVNRHAFVDLSVTYTFGYGKKVKEGNEAYQQSGAGSGILK